MADSQTDRILRETRFLRGICKYLFDVGDKKTRFARNLLQPAYLSFQVEHMHLADAGKLLMQLSFLSREDYTILQKVAVLANRDSDTPLQAAYRTVFFDVRLHRWLLFFIEQHLPPKDSRFQPLKLLPGILVEVKPALAEYVLLPPEEAFARLD